MDEFTIIGLRELRENMEVYIEKIQHGGSFVVVRKSKVVFRIEPVEEKSGELQRLVLKESEIKIGSTGTGLRRHDRGEIGREDAVTKKGDDDWEEVVDFTKVKKGGVSIDDMLTRL